MLSSPGGSLGDVQRDVAVLLRVARQQHGGIRVLALDRLDPVTGELAPRLKLWHKRHYCRMARIPPVDETSAPPASRSIAAEHLASGSRMTNMKWTLGAFAGRAGRAAAVVSAARRGAAVPRRAAGVAVLPRDLDPERLPDLLDLLPAAADRRGRGPCRAAARRVRLADRRTSGGVWPSDPHSVDDAMHAALAARLSAAEIVTLMAFGAIMVATNVFNDAMGVELDGYLERYAA